MCGIAGVIDRRQDRAEQLVSMMHDQLAHRGPDDEGVFVTGSGTVGLAHQRLSILDLTSAGRQPMSSEDGRYTVVFNGEIYNYQELRNELAGHGVLFSTNSDTEVLLKAYQQWGDACLEKLLGMYAFAIWDADQDALLLVRDRVGKKPVVYSWDGEVFAFASEVKALLTLPGCARSLNPAAIDAYLALGYSPAPASVFRSIFKLPAGHCLRFQNGEYSTWRYWKPEESRAELAGTQAERIDQFRELFAESVRVRLRSDVPIGLFLSGGIDSSAIAAECVRQGHYPKAFTVKFDKDDTDLPYAESVARQLGLKHEVVEMAGTPLADDLQEVVTFYDEPFADTSNVPSYRIAQETRGCFKVVLNGDGGDEAFGGYRHYEYATIKQWTKRFATVVGACDGSLRDPWQTYFRSKALFRETQRRELLAGHWVAEGCFRDLIATDPFLTAYKPRGALDMAMWADRHMYLPNDLLYKMDIALMSQGIEGRSPLLDHRLLEWTQRLPPHDRVHGRTKKALLSAAFRGILPDAVLNRPKHGFGSPIQRWLNGPLKPLVAEYLPCPLFSPVPQQALLRGFAGGASGTPARVWTLLLFALWAKHWRVHW